MLYIGNHKVTLAFMGRTQDPDCYMGSVKVYPEAAPEPVTTYEYGDIVFSIDGYQQESLPVTGGSFEYTIQFYRPYTATTRLGDVVIDVRTGNETIDQTFNISGQTDYPTVFTYPSTARPGYSFKVTAKDNTQGVNDRDLEMAVYATYQAKTYRQVVTVTQPHDSYSLVSISSRLYYSETIPASGGSITPTIYVTPVYKWVSGGQFTGSPIYSGFEVLSVTGTCLTNANGKTASLDSKTGKVTIGTLGVVKADEATVVKDIVASVRYQGKAAPTPAATAMQDENWIESTETKYFIGNVWAVPASTAGGDVYVHVNNIMQCEHNVYSSGEGADGPFSVSTANFGVSPAVRGLAFERRTITPSSTTAEVSNKLSVPTTTYARTITVTVTVGTASKSIDIAWTVAPPVSQTDFVVWDYETQSLGDTIITDPSGYTYHVGDDIPFIQGSYLWHFENITHYSQSFRLVYDGSTIHSFSVAGYGTYKTMLDLKSLIGDVKDNFVIEIIEE